MAAPTSYTETTFKEYLHIVLGAMAAGLGWTVGGGDYDEVVNETLLAYAVDDIAAATDIRKLRALGRYELWRAVVAEVAGDYDYRADGGDYKRSQVHKQAMAQLARAEEDALEYDSTYAVQVGTLTCDYDPYQPEPLDVD